MDYDETYEDVLGAPECWVDGYDAGFAQKYDENRANKCNEIPGDQYNASWQYGCIDSRLTKIDCNQIKDNPVDIQDHEEALYQENVQNCWNDGYEDGKADNPFNKDRASGCSALYISLASVESKCLFSSKLLNRLCGLNMKNEYSSFIGFLLIFFL